MLLPHLLLHLSQLSLPLSPLYVPTSIPLLMLLPLLSYASSVLHVSAAAADVICCSNFVAASWIYWTFLACTNSQYCQVNKLLLSIAFAAIPAAAPATAPGALLLVLRPLLVLLLPPAPLLLIRFPRHLALGTNTQADGVWLWPTPRYNHFAIILYSLHNIHLDIQSSLFVKLWDKYWGYCLSNVPSSRIKGTRWWWWWWWWQGRGFNRSVTLPISENRISVNSHTRQLMFVWLKC